MANSDHLSLKTTGILSVKCTVYMLSSLRRRSRSSSTSPPHQLGYNRPAQPPVAKFLPLRDQVSTALKSVRSELAEVDLTPPGDDAAAKTELERMGVVIHARSNVAARNRVGDFCQRHHLALYTERARWECTMRTGLRTALEGQGAPTGLWLVEWDKKGAEVENLVFVVVYRVAVAAHACLIQQGLVAPPAPPNEKKDWVTWARSP